MMTKPRYFNGMTAELRHGFDGDVL